MAERAPTPNWSYSDESGVTKRKREAKSISSTEHALSKPSSTSFLRASAASPENLRYRTRPVPAPKPVVITKGHVCLPRGASFPSSAGGECKSPESHNTSHGKCSPKRSTQVQSDVLDIKENYFDSPTTKKPTSYFRENTKGDYESQKKNFLKTCCIVYDKLEELHIKYKEHIVPTCLWENVQETKKVLKGQDISISVVGEQNRGKSTFINALIGEEILPIFGMSETSLKVKIQHDMEIHPGVCQRNCPYCPRLRTKKGDEFLEDVVGPQNINLYLQQRHTEYRQARSKVSSEPLTMILKVNIPLLSGSIPPGWEVSIVDNPGFGEAKDHITQLAEASMVTSSAYIYLMQAEDIGGKDAANFFKTLQETDQGAIADGRLTIGITKFDIHYSTSKPRRSVTVEMVKQRVIESIQEATNTTVSEDMIIPLCGEWALSGSKLLRSLISGHSKNIDERCREAATVLKDCPQVSLPGGQGQDYVEAIMSRFSPLDLVEKLESVSGISDMKARIGYVVGKACVKLWATKIHTQFQNYVFETKGVIKERGTKKQRDTYKKAERHSASLHLQNKIKEKKRTIEATLAHGRHKASTKVWKNFELAYSKDLEKYKPQEAGKEKARTLIICFREECKKSIEDMQFGPREFETALKEFLDRSATDLQTVFDSAFGFWNMQDYLQQQIVKAVDIIADMKVAARNLLKNTASGDMDQRVSEEVSSFSRRESIMKPPSLGDIKLKISIPEVALPWWKKIVYFFRGLLQGTGEVPSSSPTSEQDTCSHKLAKSEDQPHISDDSDNDTWLESSDEVTEHKTEKIQQISRKCSSLYKSWTVELEETLRKVQTYMEEECDRYFKDIKHKAVWYFYRDYYLKTKDRLEKFDQDFGESLKSEEEKLERLQTQITTFTSGLEDLKKAMDRLSELETGLCAAYTNFCIGHAEHMERETQRWQKMSYHDNLKLAKKEAQEITERAKVITELCSF